MTDIQRKYRNNFHRGTYVAGGEVLASEDETVAGSEFIITSIPRGVYVEEVIVVIETEGTVPAFTVTDEGGNINVNAVGKTAVEKVYPNSEQLKLTLTDALTDGRVVVLYRYLDVDVTTGGRVVAKEV